MSLRKPIFVCTRNSDGSFYVQHNCNGNIGFTHEGTVTEQVARLIELALEEGKRRRSAEIVQLLGDH